MRFSAIFQLPLVSRHAVEGEAPARVVKPAAPALAVPGVPLPAELPEELDQRVRLIGEWQLGEG